MARSWKFEIHLRTGPHPRPFSWGPFSVARVRIYDVGEAEVDVFSDDGDPLGRRPARHPLVRLSLGSSGVVVSYSKGRVALSNTVEDE